MLEGESLGQGTESKVERRKRQAIESQGSLNLFPNVLKTLHCQTGHVVWALSVEEARFFRRTAE